ncbi:MAG: hypothetical protein Q7S45_02495 [Candidatus Curtissbacteria bacterium]|nr:hypothetical protein [Candidatus Curtissbacteria bacterium]
MKKTDLTKRADPRVKEVLILLGAGTFLAVSLVFPVLPLVAKPFLKSREEDDLEWKKFNLWRLRALLARMKLQKLVEIASTSEGPVVKITEKGKKKVLNFRLGEMKLKESWDGKWRVVMYDVPRQKKREADFLRLLLKKMKFLVLQKSVYLTPYPCEDEIEYLRQMLGLADDIKILKVARIENDSVYRDYFGIK